MSARKHPILWCHKKINAVRTFAPLQVLLLLKCEQHAAARSKCILFEEQRAAQVKTTLFLL